MADNPKAVDIDQVFQTMGGYMASAAVKAGLDLELFTHISKGANFLEELATTKSVSPRAIRILCDALVAFGILEKHDGRYQLPPLFAAMLVKGSPAYMGAMSKVVLNPILWEQAGKLSDVVRAGHSLLSEGAEAPDNPFWQDFQRGSRQMAAASGPILAEIAGSVFPRVPPKKVLDIASGSGYYGFAVLQKFRDARLVSVDWPSVLKLTEPIAEQLGLKDRVEFLPGDIFKDDLGSGYDLVLAVNIFHHFSMKKNIELARRLYAATAPGGSLIIVDMVPDENREKHRFALTFALTMLIWTQEGDTYTLAEYDKMLGAVGYRDVMLKEVPRPLPLQAVVATKQPTRT